MTTPPTSVNGNVSPTSSQWDAIVPTSYPTSKTRWPPFIASSIASALVPESAMQDMNRCHLRSFEFHIRGLVNITLENHHRTVVFHFDTAADQQSFSKKASQTLQTCGLAQSYVLEGGKVFLQRGWADSKERKFSVKTLGCPPQHRKKNVYEVIEALSRHYGSDASALKYIFQVEVSDSKDHKESS